MVFVLGCPAGFPPLTAQLVLNEIQLASCWRSFPCALGADFMLTSQVASFLQAQDARGELWPQKYYASR